ncbi:MAG: hypothetical protein V4588_01255, partial [Pseudomonadota bacterium]
MMYPKSFLKLLLLGFALALLPLLFAFGNAALYVDRLATQSRSTVAQAVQATRASRVLVEQLNLMERSARQYSVLNDEQLLDHYKLAHQKFTANLQQLGKLPLSQQQLAALAAIGGQETALFEELASIGQQNAEAESAAVQLQPGNRQITGKDDAEPIRLSDTSIEQFRDLSRQAQDILAENNRLIDHESASLAENAEHL